MIVTGLPGTGKTTLARQIAQTLRLPLIYKDGIKEKLFDTLGWSDREWSKKLGAATIAILFHMVEAQLAAGKSLVVESNFKEEFDTARFLAFKSKYGYFPIQIQLVADGETLYRRFQQRSENGERHPGHVDHLNYAEFEVTLRQGRRAPLGIGGEYIEVDTTDFERADFGVVWKRLAELTGTG